MKRTRQSFTGTVIYSKQLSGVYGQSARSQGYEATRTILRVQVEGFVVEARVASPVVGGHRDRYGRGVLHMRTAAANVGDIVTISGLHSGRRASEIYLDSARLEVSA